MWYDKDSSLLKGSERQAQAKRLQPFTSNDNVSIQVKNHGCKTVNNQ
jgi:hypothetical protein